MASSDPDSGWVMVNGMEPQEQVQLEALLVGSTIIGDITTIKKLVSKGLNINFQDPKGESILHLAVENGNSSVVDFLLLEGANVNIQDKSGSSPLHWACDSKNLDIIKKLLQHGANTDAKDKGGSSCVHWAAHADVSVMKLLLEHGATLDIGDNAGVTPLHVAAYYGKTSIVKLLLERGARVCGGVPASLMETYGNTALHSASERGHSQVMELLIDHGADPNRQDASGFTPLHLALRGNHYSSAEILLKAGADMFITNNEGHPAKSEAKTQDLEEMLSKYSDGALVKRSRGHVSGSSRAHSTSSVPILIEGCDEGSPEELPAPSFFLAAPFRPRSTSTCDTEHGRNNSMDVLRDTSMLSSPEKSPSTSPRGNKTLSSFAFKIKRLFSRNKSNTIYSNSQELLTPNSDLIDFSSEFEKPKSSEHVLVPHKVDSTAALSKSVPTTPTHIHSQSEVTTPAPLSTKLPSDSDSIDESDSGEDLLEALLAKYPKGDPALIKWLHSLGLSRYVQAFLDEEWDSDSVKFITEMDLVELGLKGGARRKILADKSRFPLLSSEKAASREEESYSANTWQICYDELQFTQELGKGYYGSVYKGFWNNAVVAIKQITREATADKWLLEVELLSCLRHPNIILFYGSCRSPHGFCIITEYAQRGNLREVLTSSYQEVSLLRELGFAIDVCRGMAYLHKQRPPVIHRDLKSDNVLVLNSWTAKVSDFGLSRLKDYKYTYTSPTCPFDVTITAPEVLEENHLSEMADVWSFSLLLWELRTRTKPFQGKNPHWVANQVIEGLRPTLTDKFDPPLVSLLRECWQRDYKKRPSFKEILPRLLKLRKDVEDAQRDETSGYI